ncbi:UDP-glucose 4-epimerase GalE [Caldinitratiruptor microaerophilus]|uniref:UDP-glucose 4-epimerase n=1 Tax=Caldinitratiruptor microaerophilus TaxID=671077 RepID=A0AA35CKL2_9FIRM|nr:UDP-glucose 4-epimerase GalE [Caldinitratiruptor microaerophilus]BDG60148.1 UDP-glucose 4-epimerase GalE [Caldinitratiruptor microaerophilus]
MATILVTGGAGYIGSHTVRALLDAGDSVVVVDDLSRGHREAVDPRAEFVQADAGDRERLAALLTGRPFDAVIHFAGLIAVGESMADPARYHHGNVVKSAALFDVLRAHGVTRVVFSSSAAVYGEPETVPIPEDHPLRPTSVYGETKLWVERMLAHYARAYGFRYVALRYFNAAGAHPDGTLGEAHDPETHLIPLAIGAALGTRPPLRIFGTDYPTPDGTAIRDYIHVCDLADAHLLAVRHLLAGAPGGVYNVGTGRGHSVREVLAAAELVTGRPVPAVEAPRRPGDPARLVAAPDRIRRELGWEPRYGLEDILRHAWRWHSRQGGGRSGSAGGWPGG